MDPSLRQRLSWRRQFILGPEESVRTAEWYSCTFRERWHLSAHPDLPVCHVKTPGIEIILLGWVFDTVRPSDDREPAELLADEATSFDDIESLTSRFGGRWAAVVGIRDRARIYPDCGATCAVNYTTKRDATLWIASSASLIVSEPASPIAAEDRDDWFLKYVPSAAASSISSLTPYAGIARLLPNHFLELDTWKTERFWPVGRIQPITVPEAVHRARNMLENQFESSARNNEVFIGLTGGVDSRVLLAARKASGIPAEYFHIDMRTARSEAVVTYELARKFDETVHILNYKDVPDEVEKPFSSNTSDRWPEDVARQQAARAMTTGQFMDRPPYAWVEPGRKSPVSIHGHLGEVVRGFRAYRFLASFEDERFSCIDSVVARVFNYYEPAGTDRQRIIALLEDWIRNTPSRLNYRLETAFYWEWRIGAWLSDVYCGSDLFYPRIAAYNIRSYCELGLGVGQDSVDEFIEGMLADVPGLAQHPFH